MVLCLNIEQCGACWNSAYIVILLPMFRGNYWFVSLYLWALFCDSPCSYLLQSVARCCKHLQSVPKLPLLRLCCETALVNDPGVDDRRGTAGQRRTQSTWSSVETVRFRLCWTVSAAEVAKPKLERHSMSDCYLLLSALIFSVAPDRSRAFLYFLTCVLLCSAVTPTLSAPVDCPIDAESCFCWTCDLEFWARIHMENFL